MSNHVPVVVDQVLVDDVVPHQRPAGEQLRDVVDVGRQLHVATLTAVERGVRRMRLCGASWAEVGRSLGVSRQAAQKRWAPVLAADGDDLERGVELHFEHLPRGRTRLAGVYSRELDEDLLPLMRHPQGVAIAGKQLRQAVEAGGGAR